MVKGVSLFFILTFITMTSVSQVPFSRQLFDTYDTYAAPITSNRFTHAELTQHIDGFATSLNGILTVEELGRSAEGRGLRLLKLGTGPTKVFFWSQMHGDEPTATMALMDMLSYIRDHRDSPEIRRILSETTLLILPMVNPDGAERFQRRTVYGIDMNRDAARLQTPEAKILKSVRDRYDPEIGLNLHDMDPRFTVGKTDKVAGIALLTPAFDYAKTDNAVRLRAKHVAAELVGIFSAYIDGHISKYDDAYEPRAFGDNMQGWGTSTVLIESGGWKGDPQKFFLRKLNCVAFLTLLQSIAARAYEKADIAAYDALGDNTRALYDIIVEKVTLRYDKTIAPVTVDLGIHMDEVKKDGTIRRQARITELGDLSTFHCFERINAEGVTIDASAVKLESVVNMDHLRTLLSK
jgi:Zinc carboxypeptidase